MLITKQNACLMFRLSLSITVFSALFNSIPNILTVLGAMGMILFLGIQLSQTDKRVPLDYARLLLIVSFAINYGLNLFTSPFVQLSTLGTKLALIVFLVLYIKKIITSLLEIMQQQHLFLSGFGREDLSHILADLATVYIVIASLFKILHWEMGIINGNMLLAVGLFAALLSLAASPRGLTS